jgi:hypothetical protein
MGERDRWRAEALRLRESGRLMALAIEALRNAAAKRGEAEGHQRDAAASLEAALNSTEEAIGLQTEALRQFLLPGDLAEN